MRVKRVEKFRKCRKQKLRKALLFTVLFPGTSVLIGYLITSLWILPSIAK